MFPQERGGRQSGQGSVEYVGLVVAVGALLVGLVMVFPSIGDTVACKFSQAVASVTGGSASCSGGTSDARGTEDSGEESDVAMPDPSPQPTGATRRQPSPQPGPSPLPTYPGLPYGLDPNSDLVKTLQLTERGRQTLRWLADNKVHVYIDEDTKGAYWNGRSIEMAPGPGEALTLIHEANHARYDKEGRRADAKKLSRDDYIEAKIAEEVDGTLQEVQAVRELRSAGYSGPPPAGELEYDSAYQNAKASGASDAEAEQAGRDAVERAYSSGKLLATTNGQTYSELYGNSWDSQHSCYFLFIRWQC
jgi:hypothetical protein